MPITVLIAGQTNLVNDALCRSFSQRRKHFRVVGVAQTLKDLLKQVTELQPDVILIGVNMGNSPMAGMGALRELSLIGSSPHVIVLSDCSDPAHVVEAFSHGARGFFCENEDFATLCKSVRSVYSGQVWADSTQLQWVLQAFRKRDMVHLVSAKGIPLLTEREEQIVRMVAEGLPNTEICSALGLSHHTVKNHLFNIYNKLGISRRAELQLYALGSRDNAQDGDDLSKQTAE